MNSFEFPEEAQRLFDRWYDDHLRTGNIPARIRCGDRWYDVSDCGLEDLHDIATFKTRELRAAVASYGEEPSGKLAQRIAGHMIAFVVADQLLEWAREGKPAVLL